MAESGNAADQASRGIDMGKPKCPLCGNVLYETDQQMYDRIYGHVPIDGTGWAEAAFEPHANHYGPQYYVRAGRSVSPFREPHPFVDDVNHHPDALRGMGE